MNNPFIEAGLFLINTLLYIYILLIILRFILQIVRADFYNSISQLIIKLTNFPLRYMRRIIPGYAGVDFASVVLIVLLEMIKIILICMIKVGVFPNWDGLLLWMLGDITAQVLELFFYAILLQVIISWINPVMRTPISAILYYLTEPLLRPVRRYIAPISGFDLSPIPVMIVLQLLILLIAHPLVAVGKNLILTV